jgi:hypothetical protein
LADWADLAGLAEDDEGAVKAGEAGGMGCMGGMTITEEDNVFVKGVVKGGVADDDLIFISDKLLDTIRRFLTTPGYVKGFLIFSQLCTMCTVSCMYCTVCTVCTVYCVVVVHSSLPRNTRDE